MRRGYPTTTGHPYAANDDHSRGPRPHSQTHLNPHGTGGVGSGTPWANGHYGTRAFGRRNSLASRHTWPGEGQPTPPSRCTASISAGQANMRDKVLSAFEDRAAHQDEYVSSNQPPHTSERIHQSRTEPLSISRAPVRRLGVGATRAPQHYGGHRDKSHRARRDPLDRP